MPRVVFAMPPIPDVEFSPYRPRAKALTLMRLSLHKPVGTSPGNARRGVIRTAYDNSIITRGGRVVTIDENNIYNV